MLDICLLGNGGTMPIPNRWLTSMIASYLGKLILIDCGEGTQIPLKRLGWGLKAIEAICFTHYHADHVVGLPGLLLTIGNSGRTEPLTLIGPTGLNEVIRGLTVIAPNLPYELHLIELPLDKIQTVKINHLIIHALPVEHTIPCLAYTLEVKRGRKFNPEKAKKNDVPLEFWKKLQKEEEVYFEGKHFTPDMVLDEPRKGLKVAYCTDTRPTDDLIEFVRDADLLIAEGMYGSDAYFHKAEEHKHMLFSEAATLAKNGQVKELWLTHFSPSLTNPEDFLEDTQTIFPNTKLGEDLLTKSLFFTS